MRTLYIDCSMGAAGDMLTAALLELLGDADAFIEKLNDIGIPGVTVMKSTSIKCGITGTHITVNVNGEEENEHMHEHPHDHDHNHEHDHIHQHQHHRGLHEIEHIISEFKIREHVKKDIMAVYKLIAEAESHAHGIPVTDIHFHEVGTMDAITDITAVCMLMDELGVEKVVVSPIHVGGGHVKCAHGILPVPAPATAYILRGCPIYGGGIKSELCTPTGAALLKYYADSFGEMPTMTVSSIGYGMGNKDFETANCVRVMLGDTIDKDDTVTELCCNLDDMTAEEMGFAMDRLFEGNALDVYIVPAGMKKNRPGHILHVMCENRDKDTMVSLLFKYTTTIGVREYITKRYTLNRETRVIDTEYGTINEKITSGYGVMRSKYEFDDLSRIAKENGLSLNQVRRIADERK